MSNPQHECTVTGQQEEFSEQTLWADCLLRIVAGPIPRRVISLLLPEAERIVSARLRASAPEVS